MKKSFLKTAISNSMDGTEDDHLWQDSGERIIIQEWEDLFGESDDEDFEGFV